MSSLRDKLKKLSFFTHYPKEHETLTINNVTEDYPSKKEMWDEWFNETITVIEFTGTTVNIESSLTCDFSSSIVDWCDGTVDSPTKLDKAHTYETTGTHTVKIINAPYEKLYCFKGFSNLTSVIIPLSVTSLGLYCFGDCTSLTSINIPSSVTSLENSCFNGCTSLTSVIIPSSITSLPGACFEDCSSLTSINIPSTVTSIKSTCFYGCTSLTSIEIPDTVTSIGANCFRNCTNLMEIILNWMSSDEIVTYNSTWITNANANLKFIIPSGTTSLYTAKGYPTDKLQET